MQTAQDGTPVCNSYAIKPETCEDHIEALRRNAEFRLVPNCQRRILAQALRPSFQPIM